MRTIARNTVIMVSWSNSTPRRPVSSPLIHVTGLDVQGGYEEAFDRWYADVHVAAALSRAGWQRARLYRCLGGEPTRLSIFDLDQGAAVEPAHPPFLDDRFGRRVRNYHARTLRRILSLGADPAEASLINLITVDVADQHAAGLSRWYSEVHVPEIAACPGWLGAERFESLDGDPRFMAIYGLEDAERPFATPEYEAAVGWDEQGEHLRGYHGFRIYQLERSLRVGS